jgi:hypothetical protein
MLAACTIVSCNYLHFARTLCRSFLAAHPGAAFYVLLVDRPGAGEDLRGEPFTAVWVEELGIPDFLSVAFQYGILELNTNVKPSFLKWLLDKKGVERLVYLDPDIFVYSDLGEIDERLRATDIVLTPHMLSPIRDDRSPAEQDFLRVGVFNLGFIGVSNRRPARELLDWWEARCLSLGYLEQRSGLFVDQKWMNFAPCFFPDVGIIRDPGCNVAYWNLHERTIGVKDGRYQVDGAAALKFFHFSGIDLDDIDRISKHQNRFTLRERRDLAPLFEAYRGEVRRNASPASAPARYAFGYFSNGALVTELARRVYAMSRDKFSGGDPFDANGEVYAFARRARLLSDTDRSASYGALDVDPRDLRLRLVHAGLRFVRFVLGPDRYTMLMRYLGYISILRNQRPLFWRD